MRKCSKKTSKLCNMLQVVIPNLEHYCKAIELVKSAFVIFTKNISVMFLMICSGVPFFVFMVIFELKLYKAIPSVTSFLLRNASSDFSIEEDYAMKSDMRSEVLSEIVKVCVLYIILYPVLELFSMAITVKLAARVHAGDQNQETELENVLFYEKQNPAGRFIACLCVQLVSVLTLVGFLWILVNLIHAYETFSEDSSSIQSVMRILSMGLYSLIFCALLYKYFSWSASWNMSLVIAILDVETGIEALGLAYNYSKRFDQTGLRLMQICFTAGYYLRLPYLCVYLYSGNAALVQVTTVSVVALACLKNLVKWIAVLLYFYDCKDQTLNYKKIDAEDQANCC